MNQSPELPWGKPVTTPELVEAMKATEEEDAHQKRMAYFTRKSRDFRRAMFISEQIGADILQQKIPTIRTLELGGAHRMALNAQRLAEGNGPVVSKMRELFSREGSIAPKEFGELIDASAGQLLERANTDYFDVIDVLVGTRYFELASRIALAEEINDPRKRDHFTAVQLELLECVMLRLLHEIPLNRIGIFAPEEIAQLAEQALGKDNTPDSHILARLSNATFEQAVMIKLALPHARIQQPERKIVRNLTRNLNQLLGSLAELSELQRMPTLVVRGADIGLHWDVIMGHPASYGVALPEDAGVVCDFFLTLPKEVHRLPTIKKQYKSYSINFGNEYVELALRLFRDGSVDFGLPLLLMPHRTIDRTFRQLRAESGLRYFKCLLTALAVDAATPPVYTEKEVMPKSLPRMVGEAIREGVSPLEVMSTIVIPQRIEIVRRVQREEEEAAAGTGTPKSWHIARAHARTLREGFTRSEENLTKYLEDLRRGEVDQLPERDHRAIIEGTKCYIARTEKGSREHGEVVGVRAILGEGATRRVLRRINEDRSDN